MTHEAAVPRHPRTIALPGDRSVSALWAPWCGQDPIQMRRSFWRCSASDQAMLRLPAGTWLSVYLQKPNLAWLESLPPHTLQGLSLSRFPAEQTLAALESASHQRGLIQLFLVAGPGVTGADLGQITLMEGLEELRLEGSDLGDELIEHLEGLDHLVSLTLERTRVTDEGLSRLTRLAHLSHLSLTGSRIGAATLHCLREMESLRQLDLEGCEADEAALAGFREVKKLRLLTPRAPVRRAGAPARRAVRTDD